MLLFEYLRSLWLMICNMRYDFSLILQTCLHLSHPSKINGFIENKYLSFEMSVYTNIEINSWNDMKILVDENLDGMDERLKEQGFDAYSVRKLQITGKKLGSDYSIINYARENDMIIITKDTEFRKASEENDFPLILLDDEEILKVIVEKLKKL